MGSCLGEAIAPIVVGKLMGAYGAKAFPAYIFVTVATLFAAYSFVHFYMRSHLKYRKWQEESTNAEGEVKPLLSSASVAGDGRDSFPWMNSSPRQVVELVQSILMKNRSVSAMNGSFLPASATRSVSNSSRYGSVY